MSQVQDLGLESLRLRSHAMQVWDALLLQLWWLVQVVRLQRNQENRPRVEKS